MRARSANVRTWAALAVMLIVVRIVMPATPNPGSTAQTAAPREAIVTGSVVKMAGRLTPTEMSLIHNASLDRDKLFRAASVDGSVRMILADARSGRGQPRRSQGQDAEFGGRTSGPADPLLGRTMQPDLNHYRRDAIEALKTGGDKAAAAKISPLAAAFPDSLVVVCEAGCRPSSDRIVYRVSKVAAPAAEIAKRRLVTTAAEAGDGSNEVASVDNAVVCIAGCYDDDRPARRSAQRRRAESRPAWRDPQRVRTADRRPVIRPQTLPKRQRPAREVRPVELAAATPVAVTLVRPMEIAVRSPDQFPKIVLPLSKRAKVEVAKHDAGKSTVRARAAGNGRQTMAKASQVIGTWRTRITLADNDTPLLPGWAKPNLIVGRDESIAHFAEVASVWQTTVVYGDDAVEGIEPPPVLTWGYVIRIAP